MSQITGIVQEVNNRGLAKGSNIMVNGQKFGCYDPVKAGIDMLAAGQEVTFASSVKGQYTNIDGRVQMTGNSGVVAAPVPTPQAPAAPSPAPAYQGGGNPEFQFPVPQLNYQRSVCRREALSAAVSVVNEFTSACNNDMDVNTRAQEVLRIAAVFEEYVTGDDIERQAAAALAQLGQSQPTA